MRAVGGLAAAVGIAVAVGYAPAPAADSKAMKATDAFFADGAIPELAIEVGKKESNALRNDPRKYVKATLKDGDRTYEDIGVHLKGAAGSFRGFDDKPGLTLNMDKFVEDQLWRGMDKFHLANSVQDGSYLSELVTGEMFLAAGVPAARCGHATVTVNGRKRGLYYLKEGYDSHFLQKHFGNSRGNFYDGGFLRDVDQPLQLISGKKDVPVHSDLKALVEAARERDVGKRFARLEKVLDLDRFVSFLVIEVICWDWDGYPMKPNNYRLYHDPDRDKVVFIPSGMDQMFADTNGPIMPAFSGLVARKLMETPEGRKKYAARFREIAKTLFVPDRWVKRLDELEKRVQPALAKADVGAGRDYKNQVDRLRNAIRARAKNIEDQLKRLKD